MIAIYILILFLIAVDWFSKKAIQKRFTQKKRLGDVMSKSNPQETRLSGLIQIREPIYNKGAVLGILKERKILLHVLTFFALLILQYLMIVAWMNESVSVWPFAAVFAGGCANYIERIAYGSVTDFLSFRFLPNVRFNLADLFIFTGVIFGAFLIR